MRGEMKYKVYIVTAQDTFIEAELNWGDAFDSIEEAYDRIYTVGDDYTQYTILPYIYMVAD